MSTSPTGENNANQKTVTFSWHGQEVTVPVPSARPKKPKAPSVFLSITHSLTYAKQYEQYMQELDSYRMLSLAYELGVNPEDRINIKKVAAIAIGIGSAIGGGAAIVNSFHKNDNNSVIESTDSTVE